MEADGRIRLSLAVLLSLALVLLALAAHAEAATGNGGGNTEAEQQSFSIWAYYDGDTPVTGGAVHVYADGKELNSGGSGLVKTFPGGMTMLRFHSLPSAFRIVVDGGRAGGERVEGSLNAKVDSVSDGEIVHVNPVTTVSEALAHHDDELNLRDARDLTERTLGIPRVLDDHDLYATDRWFDGDRFKRWSMQQGSVEAGVSDLVQLIGQPGFDRHEFLPPDDENSKIGVGASAGDVLNGPLALRANCEDVGAKDFLGGLADSVTAAAGLTGPEGFVLALAAQVFKELLKDDCGKGQDAVSAKLESIEAQIAELKAHIDAKFLKLRIGDIETTRAAITSTQEKFLNMLKYAKAIENDLVPENQAPPGAGSLPFRDLQGRTRGARGCDVKIPERR